MTRKCNPIADHTTVVGYVRGSTDEQAELGAGLAAQRAAITSSLRPSGFSI